MSWYMPYAYAQRLKVLSHETYAYAQPLKPHNVMNHRSSFLRTLAVVLLAVENRFGPCFHKTPPNLRVFGSSGA